MQDNIRTVYQNNLNDFNSLKITEHPRIRNYNDETINNNDRIYRVTIIGEYQPTIEDVCQLVYYLLKNKILDYKYIEYKSMVLSSIKKAEMERVKEKDNRKQNSTGLNAWM